MGVVKRFLAATLLTGTALVGVGAVAATPAQADPTFCNAELDGYSSGYAYCVNRPTVQIYVDLHCWSDSRGGDYEVHGPTVLGTERSYAYCTNGDHALDAQVGYA